MSGSQIKQNIIANFVGNGWSAIMALVFIPFYIHFMGIEAYGLVGIFASLQALFALLDLGLRPTVNRELALLSVVPDSAQEMHHLARTLEVIYWIVAAMIGLCVILLSSVLAQSWFTTTQLSPSTVQQALLIMGLVIALRWPQNIYTGGLAGLQRQVLLNGIIIVTETVRGVGAILVLWFISPTIQAFFCWQLFITSLITLTLAGFFWHSLPPALAKPRFQKATLAGVWRFAMGISGISVTTIILTQLDKVILSKMVTLEMFGYYTLAVTVSSSLNRAQYAINGALFPRFSQLVKLGDQQGLRQLYHRACQLVSVLTLPLAVMVALFSPEILILWTKNPLIVQHTDILVGLLVVGTGLNSMLAMPYTLQLADGWTSLMLKTNILSIIILVPLLYLFTSLYGALGAAVVWLALNISYVILWPQLIHRRLLKGEKWRWYYEDVLLPLAATLLVCISGRWLFPSQLSPALMLVYLMIIGTCSLAAAALAAPQIRGQLLEMAYRSKVTYARRFSKPID